MIDVDRYFYAAKCILGFTEKEAWRLTLRQINALLRQHNLMHGGTETEEDDDL